MMLLRCWQEDSVVGPRCELEWWRSRLGKLSSITMQLKTYEAKATLGVASAAKSKPAKQWRDLEFKVSFPLCPFGKP